MPFGYDGEREGKAVLKTFWSWRRVGVPKAWRESLADIGRDDEPETVGVDAGLGESKRPQGMKRRGSRWAGENGEEDRAGCIVM